MSYPTLKEVKVAMEVRVFNIYNKITKINIHYFGKNKNKT